MSIDLTAIEGAALQTLGVVLLAVLSMVGRAVLRKLNIQLSAAERTDLDDIAKRCLSSAYTTTVAASQSAGWDHVQIKDAVVAQAVQYALARFPDAMKRANINLNDPVAAAAQLGGLLDRLYQPVAAETATVNTIAMERTETIRNKVGLETAPPAPTLPKLSPFPTTDQMLTPRVV